MFSLLGNYNNIWKSEINSSGERNRPWYLKSFILNANHIHQHLGGMQGFMDVTENILRSLLRLAFEIHGEIFACFFSFTSHNTQVLICHIYKVWVKIQLSEMFLWCCILWNIESTQVSWYLFLTVVLEFLSISLVVFPLGLALISTSLSQWRLHLT